MAEKNKYTGRILIIAPKPPYPPADGGAIANAAMLEMLMRISGNIDLFCLSTPKHSFSREKFPAEVLQKVNVQHAFVDTSIRWYHLFRVLFRKDSYRASRFYGERAAQAIRALLEKNTYEYIWIESIYAAVYVPLIRKHTPAKIILRTHNIEFRIWEKIIRETSNPLKKFLLKQENRKLKRFEEQLLRSVNGIVTISPEDSAYVRQLPEHAPETTIPFSVETHEPRTNKKFPAGEKIKLFHIGAMDWEPNREAMKWFLEEIFPRMREADPALEFHMAGRGMGEPFLSWKQPGVTVHGEVADADAFMTAHDVLVVPLLSGSGIRIKILEAMALGIPVIATTAGISGIDARPGEEVIVANDPVSWQQLAVHMKNEQDWLRQIGENGRKRLEMSYNPQALTAQLEAFLLNLPS